MALTPPLYGKANCNLHRFMVRPLHTPSTMKRTLNTSTETMTMTTPQPILWAGSQVSRDFRCFSNGCDSQATDYVILQVDGVEINLCLCPDCVALPLPRILAKTMKKGYKHVDTKTTPSCA